jgi:hypothetical protein
VAATDRFVGVDRRLVTASLKLPEILDGRQIEGWIKSERFGEGVLGRGKATLPGKEETPPSRGAGTPLIGGRRLRLR